MEIIESLKNPNIIYVKSKHKRTKNNKRVKYCYSKSRFGKYTYKIAELSYKLDRKLYNYFIEKEDYIEIVIICKSDIHGGEYRVQVDKKDFYDTLINYSLHISKKRNDLTPYCRTSLKINGEFITIPIHRIICDVINKKHVVIDHKDGDGLNNRRYNLRITDSTTNKRNLSLKNSKGNFRGVIERESGFEAYWVDTNGKKRSKLYGFKKYGNNALNKAISKRIRETSKIGHLYHNEDVTEYLLKKVKVRRIK